MKGISVSPGVVVGAAYCIHEIFVNPETRKLEPNEVLPELQRYENARKSTANDLQAMRQKVAAQVGQQEAAIFQTHQSILRDPAFTAKIRHYIVEQRLTSAAALERVLADYSLLFTKTKDDYLRQRLDDVRDVIIRLSSYLSEVLRPVEHAEHGPLIIVADELLPSHVVTLGNREVAGIVTQSGGQTSHAAILARSRGIPAVAGVRNILKQVKNGDTLVIDGREGDILINPDPETEKAYRKLEREFFHLKDHLAENRDAVAITADGVLLDLLANINNPADAAAATAMGASGVGLYRTEYLFLSHHDVPDEEEQYATYKKVIAASPQRRVTIRTLDLGGDKTTPYLGSKKEANPFMGWRSIRLSFEHPEFFAAQLRAILRAAAGKGVRVQIMFPMITTLEEVRKVRSLLLKAQRKLHDEGKPYEPVPLGIMIEVPAAAVCIDNLLEVVDFVSIGSNDLVQYLMAADRDNPRVSHLCQPLSPAVLRVLQGIIAVCNQANKPVTLCGEMAGAPRAFLLLLGMGLRSFSMSPAFIPTIKELAAKVTIEQARESLLHALRLKTTSAVQKHMGDFVASIAPDLKLLDTG
ncbi:MAG: phosphoenolpyruvate--protein phosphotransferase [Pirellulales bacterium]|nr:phosphoenolpyruvate--protein phosphotransferase [Pirellulales bacterium]